MVKQDHKIIMNLSLYLCIILTYLYLKRYAIDPKLGKKFVISNQLKIF